MTFGTTDNPYFVDGDTWRYEANTPKPKKRICGYCETSNDLENDSCKACGGPLYDDISNRRNEPLQGYGNSEWRIWA